MPGEAVLERLRRGKEELTDGFIDETAEQCDDALVEQLTAFIRRAQDPNASISEAEAWGAVGAIRILGRTLSPAALKALVDTVTGTEDDAFGEEAALQLRRAGPAAFEYLLSALNSHHISVHRRDALCEVMAELGMEWPDARELDAARQALEKAFRSVASENERILYARLLGDLGRVESQQVLLAALRNPRMSLHEYETYRAVLERLEVPCPDVYFDEHGQGFPVDADGQLHCPYCSQTMEILPEGEVRHPEAPGEPCPLYEVELERR